MAGYGVREIGPGEVAVPSVVWQRVELFLSKVTDLEEVFTRLDRLEAAQVTNSEYLSRTQAMQFLHVGSTKLWQLMRSGDIETTGSTGKILYRTDSCKAFLLAKGYSQQHVQAQFRLLIEKKQKK